MNSAADLQELRIDLENCLGKADELGLHLPAIFVAQALDQISVEAECSSSSKSFYGVNGDRRDVR